jgi:hypothetical protein
MESVQPSSCFLVHRDKIFYCLLVLIVFIIGQQSYRKSLFSRNWMEIKVSAVHKVSKYEPYSWFIGERNNSQVMSLYYRHATTQRNSSCPFIGGDTFRALADHVYDETKETDLTSLNYGETVFLKPDKFGQFFRNTFHSIRTPFVIVWQNSDYNAPAHYKNDLEDPKLLAWFAVNPDLQNHTKLIPTLLGVASRHLTHGNIDHLTDAFLNYRKPWSNRTIFLYVNFLIENNRDQREKALAQVSKIKGAKIQKEKVPFHMYLQHLGDAKFILSPPGNGRDCHRTWEALLMGAAPIVLSSEIDSLFDQLPVIIINNWSQLTQGLFLSYNVSSYDTLVPQVLSARYWRDKLLSYRNTTIKYGHLS